MLTHLSAARNRAFVFNKFVRTPVLADAINRGGFVFARKLQGTTFLLSFAAKLDEELRELIQAHNHPQHAGHRDEEIGDVLDVLDWGIRHFGAPQPLKQGMGKVFKGLPGIHEAIRLLQGKQEGAPLLEESDYPEMLCVIMALTEAYMAKVWNARTNAAVRQARAAKHAAKGHLEGWFVDVIILPREDEWCDYFAKTFTEVNPSMFNLGMSLTAETITRSGG